MTLLKSTVQRRAWREQVGARLWPVCEQLLRDAKNQQVNPKYLVKELRRWADWIEARFLSTPK